MTVNQQKYLQVEGDEKETEEKGGGEGTHLVPRCLPQQTCKQQRYNHVNVTPIGHNSLVLCLFFWLTMTKQKCQISMSMCPIHCIQIDGYKCTK